jgi:hypothetical protein
MLKLLSILVSLIVSTNADFLQANLEPAPLIEWYQNPTTYFTGQKINITWLYDSFLPTEQVRITYAGSGGTRTLTSTVQVGERTFATRLSDSSNGLASNVPLVLALANNASVTKNTQEQISILQSRIENINVYDDSRLMVSGQSAVCDNRVFTVRWRGLGQAQFGNATVRMVSSGIGGGTFGTPLSEIPVSSNMTVNFTCVRTLSPSSFRSYSFSISVAESGQSAYTGQSSSFSLSQAPTPSNTPSNTPTPSRTPSQTPSQTPTPSITPSPSPSNTPSPTPTPSPSSSRTPTPSTTETARPSVDYAGIAAAAAAAANAQNGMVAGSVVGAIVGVASILVGWKYYSYQQLRKKRIMKQKMSVRRVQEVTEMYGLESTTSESVDPTIVMYKVNAPLPISKSKKGFTPSQV